MYGKRERTDKYSVWLWKILFAKVAFASNFFFSVVHNTICNQKTSICQTQIFHSPSLDKLNGRFCLKKTRQLWTLLALTKETWFFLYTLKFQTFLFSTLHQKLSHETNYDMKHSTVLKWFKVFKLKTVTRKGNNYKSYQKWWHSVLYYKADINCCMTRHIFT